MENGFIFFTVLLTLIISSGHIKADLAVLTVSAATAAMECEFTTHNSTSKATHY
jgi:hypothetical protein